jgi:hypothetical protein
MCSIVYDQPASGVIFGSGALDRLSEEASIYAEAVMPVPIETAPAAREVAGRLGGPLALKDIGMPADGLDQAARLATENPYYNPYSGPRPA